MKPIYQFNKSSPEAEGISSASITAFIDEVEENMNHFHSFMLLRHGRLVAQGWWAPFGPDDRHPLFSLSKSFTSTAIGLAIEEGKFQLDDSMISFFHEETPENVSENLAAMQVRHLLMMATGHDEDTIPIMGNGEANWARTFLSLPVVHQPGTHFLYNSGGTFMLSAILQKVTGMTLVDYLQPRLFTPLDIDPPVWESNSQGINVGGWGLNLTTAEVARFGQLYLQKGIWQGKRIISENWVAEATSFQVSNARNPEPDWAQGYGYQFWRGLHNSYRGDGSLSQFCIIMPDLDIVLVTTGGAPEDMKIIPPMIWKHILPTIKTTRLPANPIAQNELEQKLADLMIPPIKGEMSSPIAGKIAGKTYLMNENMLQFKTITLDFDQAGSILTIENNLGKHTIESGSAGWRPGSSTLDSQGERRTASSGNWTAEDIYTIWLYFTSTIATNPPVELHSKYLFGGSFSCRFLETKEIEFSIKIWATDRKLIIQGYER